MPYILELNYEHLMYVRKLVQGEDTEDTPMAVRDYVLKTIYNKMNLGAIPQPMDLGRQEE